MNYMESPIFRQALLKLKEQYKTDFELLYKQQQELAFQACPSSPRLQAMLDVFSRGTGIPGDLIRGYSRNPEVEKARHVFIYTVYKRTGQSSSFIANWMSRRTVASINMSIAKGRELVNYAKWAHIYENISG